MWPLFLLAICSSLNSDLKLSDCLTVCPHNQVFLQERDPCNTCEHLLGEATCSSEECSRPGCDCQPGLFRNKKGFCVTEEECQKDLEPRSCECSEDEEFLECSCEKTCRNRGNCTSENTRGCFCKEPLVRNDDGECIRLEDCNDEQCGKDEVFKECGSSCPPTCGDQHKSKVCTRQCVKGCFCRDGLVRNSNGECVKRSECPPTTQDHCGANEVYKECGTACEESCSAAGRPQICTLQCVRGCFCKTGFVRNDSGKCVKREDCFPKGTCPENESYDECGTACPPTCENKGKPGMCTYQCVPGCFCNNGLVRNNVGKCVKLEECLEPRTCPSNESYAECGSACPPTCKSLGNPRVCTKQCVSGCFCNEGLVRNDEGVCVKPNECSITENCPANESYEECGSACPLTCKNLGKPRVCTKQCVSGCFCNKGLVRNDDGKCVKAKECPKIYPCPKNEVFERCGSACPPTCENLGGKQRVCTKDCVPGCFCQKGLVRNEEGKCVLPKHCGIRQTCPKNESYEECGTACPLTCKNKGKPQACTKQCVPGCFCNQGLVRNDQGKCVKPRECPPPETCPDNESYSECGSACPATCENYNKPRFCTLQCVAGCFCNQGLVRNSEGVCVNPKQCFPTEMCPMNESYSDCGNMCAPTCSQPDKPLFCKMKCQPGCFCKDGLIRNDDGMCVEPEECSATECDANEELVECAKPKWCNTCEIRGLCKLNASTCKRGCDCKKGYFRNKSGKCIPESQCPVECPQNEQYVDCVKPCNDCKLKGTCDIFTCNKGCDCIEGFFRDENGTCIPEDSCPAEQCGPNEIIVDCAKPRWCSTCDIKGNCKLNESSCKRGCDCKEGYYRDEAGICIPEDQCNETCPKNESYEECGTACPLTCKNKGKPQACTKQCVPGCFCNQGLVRNDQGKCVKPRECPPPETCPNGESYSECGSACPATCENYNKPRFCTLQCVAGCFCNQGLVRNSEGVCVNPKQCFPTGFCPQNEEYSSCVNPCNDCDIRGRCQFTVCHEGCDCVEGYHRNEDGICIPEGECPQNPTCGEDEVYLSCGTACPATCSNKGRPQVCTQQCVAGCFCQNGLVRDEEGKCVKPEQCPQGSCPPNEEYSQCVNPCNNCEIKGRCQFLVCNEGCDCVQGYFRNEQGVCIPEKMCPVKYTCPQNEEYSLCVIPCNTCEVRGQCQFLVCNEGCDCVKGYFRNEYGICIPEKKCQEKRKS